MAIEVTIPEVGESITEGILAEWLKKDGDWVDRDEEILVLETDKITMNVTADEPGRLTHKAEEGATVEVGQVVATIDTEAEGPGEEAERGEPAEDAEAAEETKKDEAAEEPPAEEEAAHKAEPKTEREEGPPKSPPAGMPQARARLEEVKGESPAVQRMLVEHDLDPDEFEGTGKGGRITKSDVVHYLEARRRKPAPEAPAPPAERTAEPVRAEPPRREERAEAPGEGERQSREKLSRLRQRIAERLVEVQQTAAILTTFNEADMSRVMALRAEHKELFKERHGVGLGFMSFFVKASVDALKTVPEVNTFIDGDEAVRNHFYDIGVAVSTDRGLVVPVVRNADRLSMAEIELEIADLARRAQDRTLELSDLTGAMFTISNGGIFGSMMSTPILNPPGSAILGMHAIQKRPVAVDDEIVVRPMMYLALSYDHRIVDGREAVTFLKRIKECIERPERMLLEV